MKMIAGLLLVVAWLGACSNAPVRYGSATEVASALRAADVSCESYAEGQEAELLIDRASCTSSNAELDIYIFEDDRARDRWLRVGSRLGGIVVGPNWIVDASERTEVVASALGGDIR